MVINLAGLSSYLLTRRGGSLIYNIPVILLLEVQVFSDGHGEEVSTEIERQC